MNPLSMSKDTPREWTARQWNHYKINCQEYINAEVIDRRTILGEYREGYDESWLLGVTRQFDSKTNTVKYVIDDIDTRAHGGSKVWTSAAIDCMRHFAPDVDYFYITAKRLDMNTFLGLECMYQLNEIFNSWDGVEVFFKENVHLKPTRKLIHLADALIQLRLAYEALEPMDVTVGRIRDLVPLLKSVVMLPAICVHFESSIVDLATTRSYCCKRLWRRIHAEHVYDRDHRPWLMGRFDHLSWLDWKPHKEESVDAE